MTWTKQLRLPAFTVIKGSLLSQSFVTRSKLDDQGPNRAWYETTSKSRGPFDSKSDLLTAQTTPGTLQNMHICYFPPPSGPVLFRAETKSNSDLENESPSMLTYFLIDSSKSEKLSAQTTFWRGSEGEGAKCTAFVPMNADHRVLTWKDVA